MNFPKDNGPYSGRIESTEFAVVNNNGEVISGPFTDKAKAVADLAEWQIWAMDSTKYHIAHRRVIRESFYLTTPTLLA